MSHQKTTAMLLRNYFVEQFHSHRVCVCVCVSSPVHAKRFLSFEHANKVHGWRRCGDVCLCCSDDGKNNSKDSGGCAAAATATVNTRHVSWKMRKSFQNKLENFQLLCGLLQPTQASTHNPVNIRRLHRFNLCSHVLRVKSIKPFAITCSKICTTKWTHNIRLY